MRREKNEKKKEEMRRKEKKEEMIMEERTRSKIGWWMFCDFQRRGCDKVGEWAGIG